MQPFHLALQTITFPRRKNIKQISYDHTESRPPRLAHWNTEVKRKGMEKSIAEPGTTHTRGGK